MLELNQARAADFELVGRRQVALAGLLSSKPRIILQREPLISTRDGAVVGYVHVEVCTCLFVRVGMCVCSVVVVVAAAADDRPRF